jgi:three-Cys-motif partner protein
MEIPDHYKGKEQGYFKHRLLEAYLERLFMIVGQYHRAICYVDCFAGPWESKGDDFEDTSIAVSLNIINKCRDGLRNIGKDVRFRALFVEEKKKSFKKLKAYLDSRQSNDIDTRPIHGKFHTLLEDILGWCETDSFVFFFVDPTGWKNAVELPTLSPLLKRPNSEFLINFMYDFVSRTLPQPEFQDDMKRIFGVVPDTQRMTPEEREVYLVSLYRKNLKQVSPSGQEHPRTACVPVLYPTKDRTLYHLVYLTHHPKGIVEFMEASEKLEFVQLMARAEAKQDEREQKKKQIELFPAQELASGERVERDITEVKEYWLTLLSLKPRYFGTRKLADMLEQTDWFPKDFQKAFGELEKEGLVKNLSAVKKRRSKFVHFDAEHHKGEQLVKVTL